MGQADTGVFRALSAAGMTLIPLNGKKPRDKNWTTRPYAVDAVLSGCNAGVRLERHHLVLDVDPRNGGDESLRRLSEALGEDLSQWVPMTRTGSGGCHLWMRVDPSAKLAGKLKGYPGIDIRKIGNQVVAPGSVHPDTGRPYVLEDPLDELPDLPPAPPKLTALLERSNTKANTVEKKLQDQCEPTLDADRLADLLPLVNIPGGEGLYEDWLAFVMGCHAASSGDPAVLAALEAWCEEGANLEERWEGFATRIDGVGFGTVARLAVEHVVEGRTSEVEAWVRDARAAADFARAGDTNSTDPTGVRAASGGTTLEKRELTVTEAVVEELGGKFVLTLNAGKFEVWMRDYDPAFKRQYWQPMSKQAFKDFFEDERVRIDGKTISKADVFLKAPSENKGKKRKYSGIVFDPRPKEMQRHKGKLNLWEGWAVRPETGDWSLLRELIEDVLCAGKSEVIEYVLNWIARMFQCPWEVAESVLVFRGDEGVGKGTLARVLMRIAGAHGLTVASSQQVAGRFNSHLRNCIFLFSDEVNWRGNKTAEGMLKALVTEPVISYEQKGKDIVNAPNIIHMMMATNEKWAVPAGDTARRFMVTDVLDTKKGDTAFWAALWAQMEAGGFSGFLRDMLERDLSGWRPSMIPRTQGLAEQKLLSLQPVAAFWLHLLTEGDLQHLAVHAPANVAEWDKVSLWEDSPIMLGSKQREALVIEFANFLERGKHVGEVATHKVLVASAKKFGLVTARDTRGNRTWVLPKLSEMRIAFEEWLGFEPGSIFGEAGDYE